MKVDIIRVLFDSGKRSFRMGKGPGHFINNHLDKVLLEDGHEITMGVIEPG